jgi:hypothetical protein
MANEVLCQDEYDVALTMLVCIEEGFSVCRVGMTIYYWN